MSEYRTGGHWGRTIIRVGTQRPDADGRRADDQLVGLMDDPALAERICALLNADQMPYFVCARCGRTNPDYLTFGVGTDRHYCLGHIPRAVRIRMWLRERLARQ